MIKLFVEGNYFFAVDDAGFEREIHKSDVLISREKTDSTDYTVTFGRGGIVKQWAFADIADVNGDPFASQAAFKTWYTSNTGFKTASGGSEVLFKDLVPTDILTGTTVETLARAYLIPANTLSADDILKIPFLGFVKTGVAGTLIIKIKIDSDPTGNGGTSIGQYTTSASVLHTTMARTFAVVGGTIKGYVFAGNLNNDVVAGSSAIGSTAFDPTIDNYVKITAKLSNGADSTNQYICLIEH